MTTFKLKPEIKARFLEALRSNKYQQGEGRLKKQDHFCCLGVLSDLAVQDGVANWEEDALVVGDIYSKSLFPEQLLSWACEGNFPDLSGVTAFPLSDSEKAGSLTYANDELEKTFPEIACLVEEYF
jgi:hypothetical protein